MTVYDSIPNIAYVGLLIPLAGMGIGAFSIWTEHQRKQKALEVLKVYAERGAEPPQSVLDGMARINSRPDRDWGPSGKPTSSAWSSFAFFTVMAVGFGLAALWFNQAGARAWSMTMGMGITSFVMAALATSRLVRALTSPGPNAG